MTEAAPTTTKPAGLLDGIEVLTPEQSAAKTRLYVCGIRKTKEMEGFDLQIRVGPACFAGQTFEWAGKGDDAKQVFRDGALHHFTDAQIAEIREKLKHRYIRFVKNKKGAITGIQDIDSSDGGDIFKSRRKIDNKDDDGLPRRLTGRLFGDERPLYEILVLEPVYGNPKLNGKTLTVSDLKLMLQEAEEEERRMTEGGDAVFDMLEAGKGGKAEKRGEVKRDQAAARAMSTTDGKREAKAGFIPDSK